MNLEVLFLWIQESQLDTEESYIDEAIVVRERYENVTTFLGDDKFVNG